MKPKLIPKTSTPYIASGVPFQVSFLPKTCERVFFSSYCFSRRLPFLISSHELSLMSFNLIKKLPHVTTFYTIYTFYCHNFTESEEQGFGSLTIY